jgi:hypothetical protein
LEPSLFLPVGGGGVIIYPAAYTTNDLVPIVGYTGKEKGPTVIMKGANSKSTDDLVKIASYGKRKRHF